MKLNLEKCTIRFISRKFLAVSGHLAGIEANRDQIFTILNMKSPTHVKEVQILNGHFAALNRFLS